MSKMDKELERKLWSAADSLRGNISSEQYMHVVIGILCLKYISDKYDKKIEQLKKSYPKKWNVLEDKDFLGTFFVPKESSWEYISKFAASNEIGEKIDQAFIELENKNEDLKGLFDKKYNREELDQQKLGMVISEFSDIDILKEGEDIMGRVYEYFLGEFFKKQGQKGGEFYTPKSITRLLIDIIDPKEGLIYDPACGTGGLFIQSKQHIIENNGDFSKLTIYGQEYQNKTWKLARINLLINGFNINDTHLGNKSADTFSEDQHKDKNDFDYVIANPPFNQKKWGLDKLENDPRWKWGIPPKNNANYAWISHMLYKLDKKGKAGIVLANGSLSASGKSELEFRKNLILNNKVDAIISLPDKLFYTTGIPACLWILNNDKKTKNILMIDAYNFKGKMLSKKLRELTLEENNKILNIYNKHNEGQKIEEIGFAKSINLKEIEENDYSFVPGRYVGFVEEEIDTEKIKKEIKETSIELKKLLNEFQDLIPKVEESIEKALNFEEKKEKE